MALRLPHGAPEPRTLGGPVRVGLNISGLLFNGGYDRANMFELKADYAQAMRRLARALAGEKGRAAAGGPVELHLVSHVILEGEAVENDYRAAERVAADIPGAVVAPRFVSPSEAKSYIAGLEFFVGSRMHACIAALSAGVPQVALAYSRKFEGLFGALGYGATVDCRSADEEKIVSAVLDGLRQRRVLAAKTVPALEEGLRRLAIYENFLAELFSELAEAREGPE